MNMNSKLLSYMAYGDAVGFLKENLGSYSRELQPFSYQYTNSLAVDALKGQWSYITQLALINAKCLMDIDEKKGVVIDYTRLLEEIKLWSYYRCGLPENYLQKFKYGKSYYESGFYWDDQRGEGFSRIAPIILANKNFYVAEKEVYKNILYVNRHPQVVLTGLLFMRSIYFTLKNGKASGDELVDDLKSYIMDLQLLELESGIKGELPNGYRIKFEQEKINYLMALDRIKSVREYIFKNQNSGDVFLSGLYMFCNYDGDNHFRYFEESAIDKESLVIFYGLLGIKKPPVEVGTGQVKDLNFIVSMEDYLYRLRAYEIHKTLFVKEEKMDLFSLEIGDVMKHPLLNRIHILDKGIFSSHVALEVESKSGTYRFIKLKK